MRDVTERKKLQDQSRDLYHQLSQAEKLASLGQTMSGVAHELNNPLATILACAERLAGRRLDELHPPRSRCHPQRRRARRPHRPQPADVRAQAAHDAHDGRSEPGRARNAGAARLRAARRATSRILEALAAGLPPVFADPHQIQQILLNLIINAEQAMLDAHGRGTLILRSWQDPERDAVVLEVNDDGPGVPEEVQTKIFDPFFTTKAVGKGTGLGLTVAYAIAQEHGGRLTRRRRTAGRGASFFLELPVERRHGARCRTRCPRRPLPAVPKGTRALVVEDELALGDAVAAALADEGFRVDRADNGEEALARVRERHYDVIICDLKMPKVDGMAFFARSVGDHAAHRAAAGVRDGRRRRDGRRTVSRRERLPLDPEAVPAAGSRAGREGNAWLRPTVTRRRSANYAGNLRCGSCPRPGDCVRRGLGDCALRGCRFGCRAARSSRRRGAAGACRRRAPASGAESRARAAARRAIR